MSPKIEENSDGRLLLKVNKAVYEERAILAAAYKLTHKAYIQIDPMPGDLIGVFFKRKEEQAETLEKIVDEFCNELIDQQIRVVVGRECGQVRDEIVKKAFSPITDS